MAPKRKRVVPEMAPKALSGKVSQKKAKGKEFDDDVWKKKCDSTATRTVTGSLATMVGKLKEVQFRICHHEYLRKTPFWPMLNAIIDDQVGLENCKKNNIDIRTIMRFFDEDTGSFVFGNAHVHITSYAAKLIFGIKDGKKKLVIDPHQVDETSFYYACFQERELAEKKKDFRLGKVYILRKIKQRINSDDPQDIKHVASLVTLYMLCSFFVVAKNQNLPWAYTSFVSDLDTVCEYDWSSHISEILVRKLRKRKDGHPQGCVQLLQYIICETTNLVSPVAKNAFPRFLKWDLRHLSTKLKSNDKLLRNLDKHRISSLTMTLREHDKLSVEEDDWENFIDQYNGEEAGTSGKKAIRTPEATVASELVNMHAATQEHIRDSDATNRDIRDPMSLDESNINALLLENNIKLDDDGHKEITQGFNGPHEVISTPPRVRQMPAEQQLPPHLIAKVLQIQITEIKADRDSLRMRVIQSEKEVATLMAENKENCEKITQLEAQLQGLRAHKSVDDEKIRELEHRVLELTKPTMSSNTQVVESTCVEQGAQVEQSSELQSMQGVVNALQKDIEKLQELNDNLRNYNNLRSYNDELKKENDELKRKLELVKSLLHR